jgi:hypothetical protein
MGDFFVPQTDDFFTEGVCFDTSKEEERQPPPPPFCAEQGEGPRQKGDISAAEGHYRGRSPVARELRPMIEAGAPSTGGVAKCFPRCAHPTRGSNANGRAKKDGRSRRSF